MKHTKGEWRVEHSPKKGITGISLEYVPEWYVIDQDNRKIAGFGYTSHHYYDKGKNDSAYIQKRSASKSMAKLIAAAPDLLEALQCIKEWASEFGMSNECFEKAQQAIKKATT